MCVGATRVQSVLEGPAEEREELTAETSSRLGHSFEVYEGKCSRGELV